MLESEITEDYQAIVAGGFRLAFRWSGDRWAHELEHRGPRDPGLLAWSFETAAEHEDPARVVSPTFQQLSFQESGPDAIQALLVGQSGPHHFSAVFEVREVSGPRSADSPDSGEPDRVDVKVEVADRCRAPVEGLASTYRVAIGPGDLRSDANLPDGGMSELSWDLGPNRLAFLAPPPGRLAFAEDGRRATRVQAVADRPTGRSTYLWTYYWQWDVDRRRLPDR